jgi:diacylglycerol kinase family enzyme
MFIVKRCTSERVIMDQVGIIFNTKAKNAQRAEEYRKGFDLHNVPYQLYETQPEDLDQTIKDCMSKHSLLLVGGGDGTIRTAAQHCAYTNTIIGVLPLGTLNHFAKELNLPSTVEEMIAAIRSRHVQVIDLAEVNGKTFINNSSLGFYPKFALKRDQYTRKINKWLSYIPSLFQALWYHKSYRLVVQWESKKLTLRTSFFMISNNIYSYEFPVSFIRTDFNKASLGIYYFLHGRIRLFKLIKALFNQNCFQFNQSQEAVEVQVFSKRKITISLDGDLFVCDSPLVYKSLPQSLNILVKPI